MLAHSREVEIKTTARGREFSTTIWVAVTDDLVYVRSVRGESARWYRRAVADPHVAIAAGETVITARARPAGDDHSVAAASQGFIAKYPKGRSLDSMLLSTVTNTTLRLEPD